MASTTGERQIGESRDDIAINHIARYEWATSLLKRELSPGARVLDAACGCAYGSEIIADAGFSVVAVDKSDQAAKWSRNFTHDDIWFLQKDILTLQGQFDAVVSIETIEHVEEDHKWIDLIASMSKLLVGTVPNQDIVPFNPKKHKFHFRHYTKEEVIKLLGDWKISDWSTQYAKYERYEMVPGDDGMTLGFLARLK